MCQRQRMIFFCLLQRHFLRSRSAFSAMLFWIALSVFSDVADPVCGVLSAQELSKEAIAEQETEEPIQLRLRASWGGGTSTLWHGSFRVQGGTIEQPHSLGLDFDGPVAHYLHHGGLVIEPFLLRAYDGVEFTVSGMPETELVWTLYDAQRSSGKQTGRITLGELSRKSYGKKLDGGKNRLFIQRAAGDDLRLDFDRSHLVFDSREEFEFTLSPTLTTAPPGEFLNCDVSLQASRTREQLWAWRETLEFDDQGSAPTQRLTVPLPEEPGAYTLVVSIEGRRFGPPIVRPKPIARREIDLVVAPTQKTKVQFDEEVGDSKTVVPWKQRLEIDPTTPGWMDRIRQLDQLNLVSRFYSGALGSEPLQTIELDQEKVVRLEPGQWHAFPLAIEERGVPHRLDVTLPGTDQQRVVVSVVEPDLDKTGSQAQLDSGIIVRRESGIDNEEASDRGSVHRVVFWPATKTPWVIVANPDRSHPAFFRWIRMFDGPKSLAEAEPLTKETEEAVSEIPSSPDFRKSRRLVGPYFEKPVLHESFLVNKLLESSSEQPVDDWYAFHQLVSRLVDYLKYSGYNSAQITIAADGSAWFPSQKLNPTPKYDSGIFSRLGRDPVRKDVVELLFRYFDAANLTLIPVVDIGAPLPELESLRRSTNDLILDQINERGQSRFQSMLETGMPDGFYQPTTPQFRQAMVGVVNEIAARYSHHSSWSGLGLRVGPGSHLYMPDASWGLDPQHLEQFKNTLGPLDSEVESINPVDCVYGRFREPWVDWRNAQYFKTLQDLENAVTEHGGSLFLLGLDNFQNVTLTRKLHPSVRGQEYYGRLAWREIGLDLANIKELERTVILPARSHSSLWSPASRRVERVMFEDKEMKTQLGLMQLPGALFYRSPASLSVPKLDQLTGPSTIPGEGIIQPEFSPAADGNRKRWAQAMTLADCQFLFDGGWGVALGQEQSTAQWLRAYRAIPSVPFDPVESPQATTNPVQIVVRQAFFDNDTWWYFVNPSPWETRVQLVVTADGSLNLQSSNSARREISGSQESTKTCTLTLDPFGLHVLRARGVQATVDKLDVSVPESARVKIEQDLNEFFAQVTQLEKEPTPMTGIANYAFEAEATSRSIPGWIFGQGVGVSVQVLEERAEEKNQFLKIESQAPVAWVRSTPFPLPQTGRLSLMVWLRTEAPENQPPLRLALEAKCTDGDYYQFANIGALAPENQPQIVTREWKPFAVHFDDLPQEGVLEMRVGFDLMGSGEVEVDRVQIYDRWMNQQDKRVLLQRVSAARHQLKQGNLLEPQQFLESYWPRLIMETRPQHLAETTDSLPQEKSPRAAQAPRSVFDRVKTWVPTPTLPFR